MPCSIQSSPSLPKIISTGANTEDEVVAGTAEGFRLVLAGDDEVVAETSEDQVDAIAAMDGIVAVLALQVIVAALIRE